MILYKYRNLKHTPDTPVRFMGVVYFSSRMTVNTAGLVPYAVPVVLRFLMSLESKITIITMENIV